MHLFMMLEDQHVAIMCILDILFNNRIHANRKLFQGH